MLLGSIGIYSYIVQTFLIKSSGRKVSDWCRFWVAGELWAESPSEEWTWNWHWTLFLHFLWTLHSVWVCAQACGVAPFNMSISVSSYSPCLIDIQTLQASYEDEEDAYHARPDPYLEAGPNHFDTDYGRPPFAFSLLAIQLCLRVTVCMPWRKHPSLKITSSCLIVGASGCIDWHRPYRSASSP